MITLDAASRIDAASSGLAMVRVRGLRLG